MQDTAERASDPQVEYWPALALIPVVATAGYYALPPGLQARPPVQFFPQALAYLCLTLWALKNKRVVDRLGLTPSRLPQGLRWGLAVGAMLGTLNTFVILYVVPWLGGHIQFLRETPHARIPALVMMPWAILLIAIGIELNFRGFLLGRLLTLLDHPRININAGIGSAIAIVGSALVFSFDPFMVGTFQHLHWIAVWDGIVWGMIWLRLRNLHATVIAHAIEVIIMYSVLKIVFKT